MSELCARVIPALLINVYMCMLTSIRLHHVYTGSPVVSWVIGHDRVCSGCFNDPVNLVSRGASAIKVFVQVQRIRCMCCMRILGCMLRIRRDSILFEQSRWGREWE
jgi:hypothetical protein